MRLRRALEREPTAFRSLAELAEATDLGPYLYPVLAELDREGVVERRWFVEGDLAVLKYRLSGAAERQPEAVDERSS